MDTVLLILLTPALVLGSAAWWIRIDLVLTAINCVTTPDVALQGTAEGQQ